MFTEVIDFTHWLRRKSPHTSTHIHYTSDVRFFFTEVERSPAAQAGFQLTSALVSRL